MTVASGLTVGILVAGLALALAFFTIRMCKTMLQMNEVLPRWAKEQGYRIIHWERRLVFQGPFPTNKHRPVYYVTVEDRDQKPRRGWVRIGWWYVVGFRESIEVHWEDREVRFN